jgi:hypothetical protein
MNVLDIVSSIWILCSTVLIITQGIHFFTIVFTINDWLIIACVTCVSQCVVLHVDTLFSTRKSITPENDDNTSIDKETHRIKGISTTKGIAIIFVSIIRIYDEKKYNLWIYKNIVDKAIPIFLVCYGITAFHHSVNIHTAPLERLRWSHKRMVKIIPRSYLLAISVHAFHNEFSTNTLRSLLPTLSCVKEMWFVTIFSCMVLLSPWVRKTQYTIVWTILATLISDVYETHISEYKTWIPFLFPCDDIFWPQYIAYVVIGMHITRIQYFKYYTHSFQLLLSGFFIFQFISDLVPTHPLIGHLFVMCSEICLVLTFVTSRHIFPSMIDSCLVYIGDHSFDFFVGNILCFHFLSTILSKEFKVVLFPILALITGFAVSYISSLSVKIFKDIILPLCGICLLIYIVGLVGTKTSGEVEDILFPPPNAYTYSPPPPPPIAIKLQGTRLFKIISSPPPPVHKIWKQPFVSNPHTVHKIWKQPIVSIPVHKISKQPIVSIPVHKISKQPIVSSPPPPVHKTPYPWKRRLVSSPPQSLHKLRS